MRLLPALLLSAAFIGCGGEGDKGPVEGTGDSSLWTVTATLARPSVTLQHGASDTLTVTVTRGGGFTGTVEIFADSTPGLGAVISNVRSSGTTTTALLTLTAGTQSDVVYTIPILVHVQATGVEIHSDPTLTVNVTRKNGFWTTAPPTLSVARGGTSGPINVHFTKTGFTDPVALSLPIFNGGPAGITATFTPNPVASDTNSTMTVSVDGTVPEGSYSAGVRVNGGGYQGTAPITITVTPGASLSIVACVNPLIVLKNSNNFCALTFTRTNLPGLITMSVTSTLPAGISVSFGPNPVGGTSSAMTVSATGGAASGSFVLNVTSGGPGVPVVTLPITVTVP
jgi:hypothetical protein